jgi:mono/diheme cytochrome c family protein
MVLRRSVLIAGWWVLLTAGATHSDDAAPLAVAPAVDFAHDVAPLFVEHCLRCHQPGNEKGELSFATPENLLKLGHVVPGDPAASYLLEVVTGANGEPPAMPKEGDPLTPAQIDTLRRWIADGAVWPDGLILRQAPKADLTWWSLQPLAEVAPPEIASAPPEWQSSEIDRFVWAKLDEQGLRPNPPADRRTLIRRVTYDLTGLPPTPEEVVAFVADASPDAYAQLIDRLLESPRYG